MSGEWETIWYCYVAMGLPRQHALQETVLARCHKYYSVAFAAWATVSAHLPCEACTVYAAGANLQATTLIVSTFDIFFPGARRDADAGMEQLCHTAQQWAGYVTDGRAVWLLGSLLGLWVVTH